MIWQGTVTALRGATFTATFVGQDGKLMEAAIPLSALPAVDWPNVRRGAVVTWRVAGEMVEPSLRVRSAVDTCGVHPHLNTSTCGAPGNEMLRPG